MEGLNVSNPLYIERAEDVSALSDFYCGIDSMDDFIHNRDNGLQSYINGHLTNLWIVKLNNVSVAFFSLSKSSLVVNNYDLENLKRSLFNRNENTFFIDRPQYPCVEIDYFAVNKNFRNQGIGTLVLYEIISKVKADKLSATLFISLDAYHISKYSSVQFYKKNNFLISEHGLLQNQYRERYGTSCTTIRMYRPLFNDI